MLGRRTATRRGWIRSRRAGSTRGWGMRVLVCWRITRPGSLGIFCASGWGPGCSGGPRDPSPQPSPARGEGEDCAWALSPGWDQSRRACAVVVYAFSGQMHHVIRAVDPGAELIAIVRAAGHARVADVLHSQERGRISEIHDDAILRARTRAVRRQLTTGVAHGVRAAVHWGRADI